MLMSLSATLHLVLAHRCRKLNLALNSVTSLVTLESHWSLELFSHINSREVQENVRSVWPGLVHKFAERRKFSAGDTVSKCEIQRRGLQGRVSLELPGGLSRIQKAWRGNLCASLTARWDSLMTVLVLITIPHVLACIHRVKRQVKGSKQVRREYEACTLAHSGKRSGRLQQLLLSHHFLPADLQDI